MKLSIVIPVYNEVNTLEKILDKVLAVPLPMERELVLVDDCSTDGSTDLLKRLASEHPDWKIEFHEGTGRQHRCRESDPESAGFVVPC